MSLLNSLTIKHLLMNKKRTIVTIIGIILSCALMVGIGSLVSTVRDYNIRTIENSQGSHHSTIMEVPYKNIKYIENNVGVKNHNYWYGLGYAQLPDGTNDNKPYLYLKAANQTYLESSKLVEGRLPENSEEIIISKHIIDNGGIIYNIGETVTLNLGERYLNTDPNKGELTQNNPFNSEEYLETKITKEYKIVGIIERRADETYSSPGYTVLTKDDSNIDQDKMVAVSITFNKVKNITEKTKVIAKQVGSPTSIVNPDTKEAKPDISYNESLLSIYGEGSYQSVNSTMTWIIVIVLGLIMIGCALVIYNSFAISILERKKQFGLMSSIGSTRKQLRNTVFFEAFIVGSIGIPLGILSGIGGIAIVVAIINHLLPGVFSIPLQLALYPTFIIIPVIYMIITILVSAFIPAVHASKISPIEAIRLNDEIKIKNKKIKVNPLIRKLFGVEGELALKTIKRNKRKYRITILSLVVSIVLFIGFSTFVDYGNNAASGMMNLEDYDISITYENPPAADTLKKIKSIKGIEKVTQANIPFMQEQEIFIKTEDMNHSKEYFKYYEGRTDMNLILPESYMSITTLDKDSYKKYLDQLGLSAKNLDSELLLIYPTNYIFRDYETQKFYDGNLSSNKGKKDITFYFRTRAGDSKYDYDNKVDLTPYLKKEVILPVYFVNDRPEVFTYKPTMIISEEQVSLLKEKFIPSSYIQSQSTYSMAILITAKNHTEVEAELRKILPKNANIYNYTEDMKNQRNGIIIIGLFLYGFISLVTLIGITSVFNTISTSMSLRRKEFAMLRSLGLSPKGFKKMIRYESLLYGLKALLYGLPLSILVLILFSYAFGNLGSQGILIPWKSVIICIFAVFIITFLTMVYATRKIKKENILDAIREENI